MGFDFVQLLLCYDFGHHIQKHLFFVVSLFYESILSFHKNTIFLIILQALQNIQKMYLFCFSVLCGDFVFVIVFPQLLLVLYYPKANTYGSVFAFFFGLLLRLLCKFITDFKLGGSFSTNRIKITIYK